MKVKDLIKELKKCPKDLEVVIGNSNYIFYGTGDVGVALMQKYLFVDKDTPGIIRTAIDTNEDNIINVVAILFTDEIGEIVI